MTLSSTEAFTGPLDQVAVVDVYTAKPPTETINRITQTVGDAAATAKGDISKLAKDTVQSAADAVKLITDPREIADMLKAGEFDKSILGDLPTTKEEAMAKLKGIADNAIGSITALQNLKGEFLTDVLSTLGFKDNAKELAGGLLGLPGSTDPIATAMGINPKLKIIYNTVETVKKQGDINSVSGAVNLLNGVLGNSELAKVIDTETQFAVMSQALGYANALGIPGVADTMMNKATTPEEKANLALQLAKNAFKHPALDTISTIMANVSKERLGAEMPDAHQQLLANYKIPNDGENAHATPTHTAALLGALTSIKTNWYTYRRNGVDIVDLTPYLNLSKDALEVLVLDPIHRVNVMIARQHPNPESDVLTLFKRDYPKIHLA